MKNVPTLLASDIDNTLTGDDEALETLTEQLKQLREADELRLFLTTGRTLTEVLDGLNEENLPRAEAIIALVGTEIYLPPFRRGMAPMAAWDARLRAQFSRERAIQFVEDIEGVEMQAAHYNTALKVSYTLDGCPDPEAAAARVRERVARESDNYRMIWSSGKDLDILPAAAGKRNAIRYLTQFLNFSPGQIITAGDSGNDKLMLLEFYGGIVVANAQPELQALREESIASLYFAERKYAAGVAEGLRYFGLL